MSATETSQFITPVTLEGYGVRLEPLQLEHTQALATAAEDGELWKVRIASVPDPQHTTAYIETTLAMRAKGTRFAFAVVERTSGNIIGSTSYHDIVPPIGRLEIGYTWYARRAQRTHVNTACKFLLLTHAFETKHANVVGFRTDNFNRASQRAIERLGAKLDGVLRGHALRRDGTIRDTVMYSITAGEWPEIKAHLQALINNRYMPATS